MIPQREKTKFEIESDEWRKWDNRHRGARRGVGFKTMSKEQRDLAFKLMRAGLSAKGLKTTRDIMRLDEALKELTGRNEEYGEWLYWITIFGEPSLTEPWGWQFEGHHVNINYFILRDQVVMSPVFMGAEPVKATSGKYKGTIILQEEQDNGLEFINSLDEKQKSEAILQNKKRGTQNKTEAFKDNQVVKYEGLNASKLNEKQTQLFLDLIGLHVGNIKEGHAKVKMDEVKKHLDNTYIVWIGETSPKGLFYYRIQSPVIIIEFDHQRPVAINRSREPSRNHIHSVVRTPNGNDYGKDLLRQHLEKHHSGK